VRTGSAGSNRGLCGKCNANKFIADIERGQRRRLQRHMWNLFSENRNLGGQYWKTVLRAFKMTEAEVWSSPNVADQPPPKNPQNLTP
jgi:hypothetical protein